MKEGGRERRVTRDEGGREGEERDKRTKRWEGGR